MWQRTVLITILAVLASSQFVTGAVVYDNGPHLGAASTGVNVFQFIIADDFQLAMPGTIRAVEFPVAETTHDGTIEVFFFESNGTNPASSVFHMTTGNLISKADLGFQNSDRDVFNFQVNLDTPVALAGNTAYWFGLHLSADYPFSGDPINSEIFWLTSSQFGMGGNAKLASAGNINAWQQVNGDYEMAFNLHDTAFAIPEPSGVLCVVFSLPLIGRRKKQWR